MTLQEAIANSPGPKTQKEYFILLMKAFCMGVADLIPGVSGGTIAFITGIYEDLLGAVASINKNVIKKLLSFKIVEAISLLHVRFIATVGFGILSAIFLLARLMHYLMNEQKVLTWALFFGLIGASIIVIYRHLEDPKNLKNIFFIFLGAVFAYFMVSLIPVDTPSSPWFIYLCGVIGISAMILPGISGSFLLLILGKYQYITGAVKAPFVDGNLIILLTFAAGSATGLLGFSKVLKFLLDKYHSATMAFLTGILIGSMKKMWPWKEVLESKIVRGKVKIIREANVLPAEFSTEVGAAIGLIILGFVAVLLLESRASHKK